MNHTKSAIDKALDRLRREVVILCEMQERHPTPEDSGSSIHNRLLLAQGKKVRASSNLLVRAIARERDELKPHPEGWSEIVRPMIRDNPQLQP